MKAVGLCGHMCGSMLCYEIEEEFCFAFLNYVIQKLEGFITPLIPLTALHQRHAARLLSALQCEQSVQFSKGQKRNQFHPDKCK